MCASAHTCVLREEVGWGETKMDFEIVLKKIEKEEDRNKALQVTFLQLTVSFWYSLTQPRPSRAAGLALSLCMSRQRTELTLIRDYAWGRADRACDN